MPKVHDPEAIWAQLIPLISNGLSLPAALKKLPSPKPSLWWVKMSVRNSPEIAAKYQDAQELRADSLADEISQIADEQVPKDLRGPEAHAFIARQRLRVQAKQWLACKLFPRRYSDRQEISIDVSQRISITEALRQAEQRVLRLREEPELIEDTRARTG